MCASCNTAVLPADLEDGETSLRYAPDDAWPWLGIVSLTREAGENVKVLKQLKKEFEAQESGETTLMQRDRCMTSRKTGQPALHPWPPSVPTARAGAATGKEEQASQASLHNQSTLRSMLATIKAATAKALQRLSAMYAAARKRARHIWAKRRNSKASGAGDILESLQHSSIAYIVM